MKDRAAHVCMDGRHTGVLREIGSKVRFQSAADWLADPTAIPISLTPPLRAEPYDCVGLHTFFENLLPKGWLLELATKKLKIAKDDAFGLLLVTCADCVRAVTTSAFRHKPFAINRQNLSHANMGPRHLKATPKEPMLISFYNRCTYSLGGFILMVQGCRSVGR